MIIRGRRILITTDAVGGVWTYTLDLATGLAAAGATIRIAVLGPALRDDQRAELARRRLDAVETGCALEWLAAGAHEVCASAQVIAQLASTWQADLVHLHASAFAASASFACPVIVTHHSCLATWWAVVRGGVLPEDFRWRTALTGEGLRRADLVAAPTVAYARSVAEAYRLPRRPCVVHNGRAAWSAEDEGVACPQLFTAGRLWDEAKNIAALDRVAPLLPWPVSAAGDVAGPNATKASFKNLMLVGRQTEVAMRRRLARRPIFVAPARFEPFGLTVLEAAQAGCALVLNDIPTFRELWEGAAVFVRADESASFAAALRALIDDGELRRARGLAARARAARYSAEAMVENTAACYATCWSAAERPAVPVRTRRTA